ncbi:MAG: saccharopine dehydrogenase [Candidatus Latescibacteria bacterium]|nr:saccharopine dehydrogenase [Candidatus Latescibacterota bacterium]NIO56200.1 saccharopine dehydrogenase [Candidatus Latescibacterota bacterium]
MKKVVVLGAGMVGGAIAADLCQETRVTAVDVSEKRLAFLKAKYPIATSSVDVSDPKAVAGIVKNCDLVIGAVPGFIGFQTLKTIIESGKNVVDISFFNEDPFELDALAKKRKVTAIVDCGVAPGLCNMTLGYHNRQMKVAYYECLVGGLPVKRSWPYQYKAPFSPIDVIEEYNRPARFVENGEIVIKPALSDAEYVEFDPIGTLEAFNTDGLRTLLKTIKVPNMKEKTLRYPGHIEYMRVIRETGLFSKDPIDVGGIRIRPIDVTAKLLFPKWRLEPDEPEFTVMRVTIRGREGNGSKEYTYHLFDRSDEEAKISSMARTTGYTCTAAARLILSGVFKKTGLCPPEFLGAAKGCFQKIMSDLKARDVHYACEEKSIEGI